MKASLELRRQSRRRHSNPRAVNNLSQGGKGGLRKEESNMRDFRKGGNTNKRPYWRQEM